MSPREKASAISANNDFYQNLINRLTDVFTKIRYYESMKRDKDTHNVDPWNLKIDACKAQAEVLTELIYNFIEIH